jgi:hypothetical protein
MDLTNWFIILAVACIAAAFFCRRTRAHWSIENRARRRTATRLIVQAVIALWSATLIALHSVALTSGRPMLNAAPPTLLMVAALLAVCGCYWLIRGAKLLKARRLFTAC